MWRGDGYRNIMPYLIPYKTLRHLIAVGNKALRGDSNDDEHDALYHIVEQLKTIQEQGKAEAKSEKGKRP